MSLKSYLGYYWAKLSANKVRLESINALNHQNILRKKLIKDAKNTKYGRLHQYHNINTYEDFKSAIPIVDYEDIKKYVQEIIDGQVDVLWPGMPIYFAKTSGTTSGVKYIPITKDSISNHINTARTVLMLYIAYTGDHKWIDGKMIFLSGSPELERKGGIRTGRLSGIVNHHIPAYLLSNQLPSYTTNCIEDWERKVERIIEETQHENMTLISGIPPWTLMYFDSLLKHSRKKTIAEIFPNLQLLIYGGVNYEPYKSTMQLLLGKEITMLETYPSSEGFIAYEATGISQYGGLLLNTNSGIFYEFIPANEIHLNNPKRLSLAEVMINVNYALIINSNAGLWGYSLGDTIKFISLNPYLIKVTGRTKQYISAFGEHVIVEEVDQSIAYACIHTHSSVLEYHVAPEVQPSEGLPYHEWFIEFEEIPNDIKLFEKSINEKMCQLNIYYNDLIKGGIIQSARIVICPKGSFQKYMKLEGKLGGQNKLPRLTNDRLIANKLLSILN